jgi:hypothetical protein
VQQSVCLVHPWCMVEACSRCTWCCLLGVLLGCRWACKTHLHQEASVQYVCAYTPGAWVHTWQQHMHGSG